MSPTTINASSLVYFIPFMTLIGIMALFFSFFALDTSYRASNDMRRTAYSVRWVMLLISVLAVLLPLCYTMLNFSISYADLWNAAEEWKTTEGRIIITLSLYLLTLLPVGMIASLVLIRKGEKSLPPEHIGSARRFGSGVH